MDVTPFWITDFMGDQNRAQLQGDELRCATGGFYSARDEGVVWTRGQHALDSAEVHALQVAMALALQPPSTRR